MSEKNIHEKINSKEWYHAIEVAPGITTPGRYNPKPYLDTMGFPNDFTEKTVLDIGCYDGFFSFEAERRGAKRVLATDRHPPDHCGFSIAHKLIGSNVEYNIASVYDLSPEIHGTFDVVLFLGVLYHLRHPILALEKIHSVCKEYAFVETHVLDNNLIYNQAHFKLKNLHPALVETSIMQFYPNGELNNDVSNWIAPNIKCVEQMLASSGFTPKIAGRFGDRVSFLAYREEFTQPYWY